MFNDRIFSLTLLILSFFIAASSSAFERKPSRTNFEAGELPIGNAVRCETDDVVGFNWRNGRWVQVSFVNSTFIFKKIDHRLPLGEGPYCPVNFMDEDRILDNGAMFLERCYSVQRLGQGEPRVMQCEEFYNEDGDIKRIKCGAHAEYTFHPDEQLLTSPALRDVRANPTNDYKDSFAIGVGKCGRI